MKVRAAVRVPVRAFDAEALWYDTRRWSSFVDGFARQASLTGDWPRVGARIVWDSHPGGRGRVVEIVDGWAAGDGQDLAVEDERLSGRQRVRFRALDEESCEVALELDYQLKRRPPGHQIVDLLFIRGAVRASLVRTLNRFAIEAAAERELA